MLHAHLTLAEFEAYLARRLAPVALLEASDHLAGCESCRAELNRLLEEKPQAEGRAADFISYPELADWIDNELDPIARRVVAAKLSSSKKARAELDDLARFRRQMNAEPATNFDAASSARGKIVAFTRWALPLAATILISVGGIWWATHVRSPSTTVTLRDGGREMTIDSPEFVSLPPALLESIRRAIRDGKIDIPPEVSGLRGRSETLAGDAGTSAGFHVLQPIATAVREVTPRFHWSALPGITSYRLNIVNRRTGDLVASQEIAGDRTSCTTEKPLGPGEIYEWEVEAWRGETLIAKTPAPPQPEACFEILSQSQDVELQRIEQKSSGLHLVLGVAKARAGLLDEAESDFAALAQENPDSKIPGQLLDQLRRQRGARK